MKVELSKDEINAILDWYKCFESESWFPSKYPDLDEPLMRRLEAVHP